MAIVTRRFRLTGPDDTLVADEGRAEWVEVLLAGLDDTAAVFREFFG